MAKFKPKTVYVIYIAATPEKVWQALTSAEFTRKYFWERSVEIEAKRGGRFALILPDGRVNVKGKVIEYDPPRKLVVTWQVEWPDEFRKLPECLVSYEIAQAGQAVRLKMTEFPTRTGMCRMRSYPAAGWAGPRSCPISRACSRPAGCWQS